MFHTNKYGGKIYKLYKFHQSLSLGCWTSQAAIHTYKNRVNFKIPYKQWT